MVRPEVLDYVKGCSDKGFSRDQIRVGLLQHGYSSEDADAALSAVPVKLGYFSKLKKALFSPTELFEAVADESFASSFRFVLFSALLTAALFVVLFLVALPFLEKIPIISLFVAAFSIVWIVIVALFFGIFIIVSSFVIAAFFHVFVKLLRGEGGYVDTYKAVAYSFAPIVPGTIIGMIPVIGQVLGSLVAIWQLVILIFGVASLHRISRMRAFLAWLISMIIVMMLFGILFALLLFFAPQQSFQFAASMPELGTPMPVGLQVPAEIESVLAECVDEMRGTRETCYGFYAAEKNDITMCERLDDMTARTGCYFGFAQGVGDPTVCKKISSKMLREECFSSALRSVSDLKICESIDPEYKDRCFEYVAMNNVDIGACKKISNEVQRNICAGNAFSYVDDLNICESIDPEYKDRCFSKVNENMRDLRVCEKISDETIRDECINDALGNVYDLKICESIDTKYKDKCFSSVAANRVAAAVDIERCKKIRCVEEPLEAGNIGDIEICKKISDDALRDECIDSALGLLFIELGCESIDPEYKDRCLSLVLANTEGLIERCKEMPQELQDTCIGMAFSHVYDPKICESTDPKYKDACFGSVGVNIGNIGMCEKISDPDKRDNCFTLIRERTGDISTCEKISEDKKDDCFYDIALAEKNQNTCQRIINVGMQRTCASSVATATEFSECFEFAPGTWRMVRNSEGYHESHDFASKDGCLNYLAISMKDQKMCQRIADAERQQECISIIETADGYSKCFENEPGKWCYFSFIEFISGQCTFSSKEECAAELVLGISVVGDSSICERLEPEYKDQCFSSVILKNMDPRVCEKISDLDKKDDCLVMVSDYAGIDACNKISSPSKKDMCFSIIATGFKDPDTCKLISNADKRASCVSTASSPDLFSECFERLPNKWFYSIYTGEALLRSDPASSKEECERSREELKATLTPV